MEKIICLGKAFNSEEERREYFRNELRTKLPELKKIEGFPIGEDEDIINLSDPPYYTACPNPWLNDFIAEWEKEKEGIKARKNDFHIDGPYASDISEGKNNPIYIAHSYHTKVPHPAIMRYILHYTQPGGDIILDGFGGSGMTAVAAQKCGKPEVDIKHAIESEFKSDSDYPPNWGKRNAINSDLSPLASHISHNYNSECDVLQFRKDCEDLIKKIKKDFNWCFETNHQNTKSTGKINYTVWSEIYLCHNCSNEIPYINSYYSFEDGDLIEEPKCPECKSVQDLRKRERKLKTVFDSLQNKTTKIVDYIPVRINYSVGTKRFEKIPDSDDLLRIEKINKHLDKYIGIFPTDLMLNKGTEWGDTWRAGIHNGITHVNQFYTNRNLLIISAIIDQLSSFISKEKIFFVVTAILPKLTILNRYMPQHGSRALVGPMANTLYVPPIYTENNSIDQFEYQQRKIEKALVGLSYQPISINSASDLSLTNDSIDYIFTDPPFGANIMYSELSFLLESWLKIKTNNKDEAIEAPKQGKSLLDYQDLMTKCFKEYFRVLKPGKWMTVEFSNTSAAVWNGIQTSLQRAGFIIASVTALNKGRGGMQAIIGVVAVNQDLVISCYKPSLEFEDIMSTQNAEVSVWDFVTEHLKHLPIHLKRENKTASIIERSPKILFDRLITFYLMRGLPVPIDARDFQEGLKQKFIERDGMYFTAEQAAEYDEKKAKSPNFVQLSLIVTNESDAIEWIKERLRKQAQKYQDIMPDFRIATQSLRKGDTLPELQDILNESFIQEEDGKWRTPDPNEAKDREALRSKVLLKEFNGYVTAISQPKAKKLKEVRVEALRAGFKNSWEQKDFKTIVTLGDMIPQNILLEDEQLLMYYDIAKDRV
jgi:DNA modification methylase